MEDRGQTDRVTTLANLNTNLTHDFQSPTRYSHD